MIEYLIGVLDRLVLMIPPLFIGIRIGLRIGERKE